MHINLLYVAWLRVVILTVQAVVSDEHADMSSPSWTPMAVWCAANGLTIFRHQFSVEFNGMVDHQYLKKKFSAP
jgi:hypothetical protein